MVSSRTKKQSVARKNPKTRKVSKTLSVKDIRSRFNELDSHMRSFIKKNNLNNPTALANHVSRQWSQLFKKHLSSKAAATLANHYNNLHGVKKGGMAPLDYVMRPGMPGVSTYGVFPTEAGADVKSVGHLDVYYNSGLSRSCGTENTTAVVPKDMGSNHVVKGGSRKRKTRRVRGGDFLTTMGSRLFVAESPSNPLQRIAESTMGQATWGRDTADPTSPTWGTVSDRASPLMNPHQISIVDKDVTQLANPSPYPAVKN